MEDCNSGNVSLDEKSCENILIYRVSYKTMIGAKPLRIMFDKVLYKDRVYDGTKYLIWKIWCYCDSIRYLIGSKSGITYVFLIIMQKLKSIKMMIYLQKKHWLQNQNQNLCFYNISLEKCSYQMVGKITGKIIN